MKTQQCQILSDFDHLILSAGGRTQRELEAQCLRSIGNSSERRVFKAIAWALTAAAGWFEAKANVLSKR